MHVWAPNSARKSKTKIRERLESELAGLDETGMALWHGRNQAANNAMVAALAIGDLPGQEENLRHAAGHYLGALRALEFSESWPEEASYWIYNRASPYAVAADCVMTALRTDRIAGISIRDVMRRIGYWSMYQFTPAGFFEPSAIPPGRSALAKRAGGSSPRIISRASRATPGVIEGADYLRNGRRPYQWYVTLSYDPSVTRSVACQPLVIQNTENRADSKA